ncbi:MAG: methionyl-tRNA formyltransferase [Candidatus Aerophobetes bacterium]|nr:methionyl-tRNA formyltransferase [Candidatus Aerophobetes bacterium]
MGILFMGTPQCSCPLLKELIEKEQVVGVITQPDRQRGRGKKISPSPVKALAKRKGIVTYQPEDVNSPSFISQMKDKSPDIIVVVAFGKILSSEFLSIPKICALNVHPSLLPQYRGPAPIPWAIIKGEKETGITIHKIEKEVDKGKIILQNKLSIDLFDTIKDLETKFSLRGATLLIKAINMIKNGSVKYIAQDEKRASYAPRIKGKDAKIDWNRPSLKIHNLVRGLNPYYGAFTFVKIRREKVKMKIWQTEPLEEDLRGDSQPGEIIRIYKGKGFSVKGGKGSLLIKEVQIPSRKSISGYDFIKGYHIKEGVILGGKE